VTITLSVRIHPPHYPVGGGTVGRGGLSTGEIHIRYFSLEASVPILVLLS